MPTENRSSNTDLSQVEAASSAMTQIRTMLGREQRLDQVAAALEACDWSDAPIANKAIILSAIKVLRALQPQAEPESYPPCDYCGTVPDYHPWHGSGLIDGVENRHIHACDECRGKLPSHPSQHQGKPVAVLYANGTVLTKADCGDVFDICCKVETPLYTHPAPAVQTGEPILLEAVAVTREDDDGLYLDWLIEGGIAAMEHPGVTLLVAPEHPKLCEEDGSAQVWAGADPGEVERLQQEVSGLEECLRIKAQLYDQECASSRHHQNEVERLRADVKRLDLMVAQADHNYDMDRATFRRELAERNALLHEIAYSPNVFARHFRSRIEAVLSASADPSRPIEMGMVHGTGHVDYQTVERVEASPPECSKCGSRNVDACKANGCWFESDPGAPVERDELTGMVDAAMVEMASIHPPLKRSECERLIRAALERKP